MTKTKEILSELRLSWRGGAGQGGKLPDLVGAVGEEGAFQIGKESLSGPYLVLHCNLEGCYNSDCDQVRKKGKGVIFPLEFPAALFLFEVTHWPRSPGRSGGNGWVCVLFILPVEPQQRVSPAEALLGKGWGFSPLLRERHPLLRFCGVFSVPHCQTKASRVFLLC